jgi:hypothetical protein
MHQVPVTVHVAIGADTIHMHPSTNGALLGQATYTDFQRLTLLLRDMLQHYRPEHNVVRRPTQEGGRGYTLTGHHEIMLPLLYAMLLEAMT